MDSDYYWAQGPRMFSNETEVVVAQHCEDIKWCSFNTLYFFFGILFIHL